MRYLPFKYPVMRTIRQIHKAVPAHMDGLITYRALPTSSVDHIDPFLFLNHHGPQDFKPNNNGLPFGPHPHRGFETLTFIIKGDLTHWDSNGYKSVIKEGGIQWMTAGSGLIHSETSSDEFIKNGGPLEILQLWMNLPSKLKMTPPHYVGLQAGQIPKIQEDGGKATVHLISGDWKGQAGPVNSITGLMMSRVDMLAGGTVKANIDASHTIFFYVVKGQVAVNGKTAQMLDLVEFNNDSAEIEITAAEDSIILLGHGAPLNEPIIAYGPFVMNTEDEIRQAYADFQSGKMGKW